MMLDHVGCSTTRNGGLSHYRALVAQKQRSKIYEKLKLVMSNQLHAALTVVKTKTASLHYENMIGLLASCGSEVGNLGHGKKTNEGNGHSILRLHFEKDKRNAIDTFTINRHSSSF